MCDTCSSADGYKSAPGSPERIAEIQERTNERILKYGHEVRYIFPNDPEDDHCFAYTIGRSVFDQIELLITGNLPATVMQSILNDIAKEDAEGNLNVAHLAATRGEAKIPNFLVPFRFIWADPVASEMTGATTISGEDIPAIQVLWPDQDGHFPDDPEFNYGTQKIFAKA